MQRNHPRNEKEKAAAAAVVEGGVDERSRLLLPSPTSTDSPVGNGNGAKLSDDDNDGGTVPLLKKDKHGAAEIQLVRSFGSLEGLGKVKSGENGVLIEDIEDGKGICGGRGIVASSLASKKARCVALVTILASSLVLWRILALSSQGGAGGAFEPPWKPSVPRIHEDDKHGGNVSSWAFNHQPLSLLDPVDDLMLLGFKRPKDSRPKPVLTRGEWMDNGDNEGEDSTPGPFPTGAWYQNLLLVDGEPSGIHRTYSIPYIVDVVGPIPGLRLHGNRVGASSEVVQVYNVDEYGLTVGAARDVTLRARSKPIEPTNQYRVKKTTNLGLTLDWEYFPMTSSIVKGMPYGTMIYQQTSMKDANGDTLLPTVASQIGFLTNPVADGTNELKCDAQGSRTYQVDREVQAVFGESDFTWIVFFSAPVTLRCVANEGGAGAGALLQVVDTEAATGEPLVIRIALLKSCTSGNSPIYCHPEVMHPSALLLGQGEYEAILRNHSNLYPGPNTQFRFDVDNDDEVIRMSIDWDVQKMRSDTMEDSSNQLIAYALPHHFKTLANNQFFVSQIYCTSSLVGPTCLVDGNIWNFTEALPALELRAPRPPAPWVLGPLAESLRRDLSFTLPSYYAKGAGDTYFSGKRLAKLGRILVIAEEVKEVCEQPDPSPEYEKECHHLKLPTDSEMDAAVNRLRSYTEVWLNGSAAIPFVYDSYWKAVVSCGCYFDGKKCSNVFPECPTFTDPGLDFGNGFFNDMHFHYGYHIYAAAVVSHFDHEWGRRFFERVLLLIRNIANPSEDDKYFPTWRHKDWYQGHSWASGIAMPYLNGKNQESSSESIAAYEAVAVYGGVMSKVFAESNQAAECRVADRIQAVGQVMTATELTAARTYWHVSQSPENEVKIYPSEYTPKVVGIVWEMMAQFQTWFGNRPYLMYGIQLLPITPVSELRDGSDWAKEAYPDYAESCEATEDCTGSGWSVLQISMLATVGHPKLAMQRTLAMPKGNFEGAAGDGHSLSNTLWYIATRPSLAYPLRLSNATSTPDDDSYQSPPSGDEHTLTNCNRPGKCTEFVLDTIAGLYSCRQRIQWLMWQRGKTELEACATVGGVENPKECGMCNPLGGNTSSADEPPPFTCPPCSDKQCASDLNRCPRYKRTYVCTEGDNIGGCTGSAWDLAGDQCTNCCELTSCRLFDAIAINPLPAEKIIDMSEDCPPCESKVCKSRVNQCPKSGIAPFLCYEGLSTGGCATRPWKLDGKQCKKCCSVGPDC